MEIIAYMYTDFPEKFGVPRQSGRVNTKGKIIFTEKFKNHEYIRGIEEYSHLWILWGFSENSAKGTKKTTVRPPRLGGNKRVGVFATRSPFRPNPIGLSCVKLEKVTIGKALGAVIYVSGTDMVNKTPIYDIKPYISYTDCIPNAVSGFSEDFKEHKLSIYCDDVVKSKINMQDYQMICKVLSEDPCPAYQKDENKVYGLDFSHYNVKFTKRDNTIYINKITDKNM